MSGNSQNNFQNNQFKYEIFHSLIQQVDDFDLTLTPLSLSQYIGKINTQDGDLDDVTEDKM